MTTKQTLERLAEEFNEKLCGPLYATITKKDFDTLDADWRETINALKDIYEHYYTLSCGHCPPPTEINCEGCVMDRVSKMIERVTGEPIKGVIK